MTSFCAWAHFHQVFISDKVEKAGFFFLLKRMSRTWNLFKLTSRIGTFWNIQINLIPLPVYGQNWNYDFLLLVRAIKVLCYLSLKTSIFTWQYNLLRDLYGGFNLTPTYIHLRPFLLKILRLLRAKPGFIITGKCP